MADRESCKHFWRVMGEKGFRWFDGHAIARCLHCRARTVVEYKSEEGSGPCEHSVGRQLAEPRPILEKEYPFCDPCRAEVDAAFLEKRSAILCDPCYDMTRGKEPTTNAI